MDYRSTYRSFINSYFLSEGLRITAGLTLPSIIGAYANQEKIGITLSIGAICITIVDNAGPVNHRKNAMLVCNAVIFLTSVLTGFAVGSPVTMGLLIAVLCFVFSMIGVYGVRAGSIGLAGLFVMVLNLQQRAGPHDVLINSVLILCGGIWYMLLSLSLYSFRPYKVTQQALGDLIQSLGEYMLSRTAFYNRDPDYDTIYSDIIAKQADISVKQNLVRELLFKSRDIVKESTNTGRITLLIFLEMNDLFERIMSIQLHHKLFHEFFDQSDILDKFRKFLLLFSNELNETGIAVKSGKPYSRGELLRHSVNDLKKDFETFRNHEISAENVEGFIGLRDLMNACEDFTLRLHTIQQYTAYDQKDLKQDARVQNYDQFVTHQDIDAKVLLDNFNWKSNTFRHSLRVSLATTIGFIISEFFPVGHGYWIMLTIIVILKPAYSITKRRNFDRLIGTILGAGVGIVIIYFVRDKQVLIACMIVLMILAYSFMRTKYLVFTFLMTPYVLIVLYILSPLHFRDLILDRVIDTAIGSGVALLANLLFAPDWAYKQFAEYLQQMLEANKNYFRDVSSFFTGTAVTINEYKLSRKFAYVALANISDALTRMVSEPKSKQKNISTLHEVVVLNYMMSTHIATLAAFARRKSPPAPNPDYVPVVAAVVSNLDRSITKLKAPEASLPATPLPELPAIPDESGTPATSAVSTTVANEKGTAPALEGLKKLNTRVDEMVDVRRKEIGLGIDESELRVSLATVKSINDQFNFIWKISEDLLKIENEVKFA